MTVIFMLPKPVSISHACLAQLFFSTTVLIALFTSEDWLRERPMVEDSGAPSLHTLALAVPVCVLGQLALGAAARHKALGVLPHIAGAAVVTGMILWLVVRILMRHSDTCSASPERAGSAYDRHIPGFSRNRGLSEPDRDDG